MRIIDANVEPVRDENGQPIGAVAAYLDITEAKQVEAQLRERERQLSTLIANLPGMVYRCRNDPRWTSEFVNDGATAISGWDRESFASNQLSWADVTHPDDVEMVWNAVQHALKHRQPFQFEYRVRHRDGSIRWVWEHGDGVFNAAQDFSIGLAGVSAVTYVAATSTFTFTI